MICLASPRPFTSRSSLPDRAPRTFHVLQKVDQVAAMYSPKFLKEHPEMTCARANATPAVAASGGMTAKQ